MSSSDTEDEEEGLVSGLLVECVPDSGVDRLLSCASPLGEVYVGSSQMGVRMIGRGVPPEEFARRYTDRYGCLSYWETDESTRRLANRVSAVLFGDEADVPLDLSGTTPFQRRVLEVVRRIPRGDVRPYAWVAREAGSPKASRAVGSVMARNPVPLLIPCHRVVRNDGTTGEYAFGADKKVELLEGEGVPVDELAGRPYLATPGSGGFCYATCPKYRKKKPEDRVRFRSAEEAAAAGYRPCGTCRPAFSR